MPTKKLAKPKAVEPAVKLKSAVHAAFTEAKQDASTGNVATAKEPADTVPAAYQGHDRR